MLLTADAREAATEGIDHFRAVISHAIDGFMGSRVALAVREQTITLKDYETVLLTIFHQTWHAPYSFARAAARCPWVYPEAKEYLLDHAHEEKAHWRWVLNDLQVIGYRGADPRTLTPHTTTQAFVALNYHVADFEPLARLATAAVLEGIGPRYSAELGAKLLGALKIGPDAASFFISHGETDKRHWQELLGVIERLELSADQWREMCAAAETAGRLYAAMYDHDGYTLPR